MAVGEDDISIARDRTQSARGPARYLPVAFVVSYTSLVFLGYFLKEDPRALTIVWPAAGLLLVTLYLAPLRWWARILLCAGAVELAVASLESHVHGWTHWPVFVLANLTDGVVGALLIRHWAPAPSTPQLSQVARFVAASAVGAAVGALIGALGAEQSLASAPYWHHWQLWWAGNWLGSLAVAPVGLTWWVRLLQPSQSVQNAKPIESAAVFVVVMVLAARVFHDPGARPASLVDEPYVVLLLVSIATFRLPPRWATTLAAAATLVAAGFAAQRLGPLSGANSPFSQVISLQLFLAVMAICTFMLSTVLLEMRRLLASLSQGESRYRSFVKHSSEAIWRIELREPLPVGLPIAEQMRWLKRHAYIAECSTTYESLHARLFPRSTPVDIWQADIPWTEPLLSHFEEAAARGYVTENLPFTMRDGNSIRHWSVNFHGEIEGSFLTRIWGVARDETGLIQTNAELDRERTRLQEVSRALEELVDASPLPIMVINKALQVQLWNPAAENLLGWAATEIVGQTLPIFPLAVSEKTQPLGTEREYGVERQVLCRNGTTVCTHHWTTPLRDAAGNITGQLNILADITEQKKLEAQLRQSQKLEALGTLAAGIAHDFNNILALLGGHLSLARTTLGPRHAVQSDLGEAESAVRRATNLVKQILTFSRPQEQALRPIDMAQAARDGLTLLRATLPKRIAIESDLAALLPNVMGDAAQIQQILVNLGINAAHAIPDGSGFIKVSVEQAHVEPDASVRPPGLTQEEYVRLRFSDSGIGMDSATLERIFDPFFTTKPPGSGTGLGLAVVRSIVSSHRGAITVQSQPGKGTAFDILFPACSAPVATATRAKRLAPVGSGKHILYLDDDAGLVELTRRTITKAGYRVDAFCDAALALAAFEAASQSYDLVVTDLAMPKLDGIEVAQQILAIRADIPVVITTGYITPQEEARARRCGVREIITKAATVDELCSTLYKVIGGTSRGAA